MTAPIVEEESRDPVVVQYLERTATVLGDGDYIARHGWRDRSGGQLWTRLADV